MRYPGSVPISSIFLLATLGQAPGWYSAGVDFTLHRVVSADGQSGGLSSAAIEVKPLAALRQTGAATFAGPLHANLPFDLLAGLLDGLVVTEEPERALALWSFLLDHGYPLTPLAGPGGRLSVRCPGGMTPSCPVEAIRLRRAVVSTGPGMTASFNGRDIGVTAWAQPERLLRVELWAHNRVIATREATEAERGRLQVTLAWTPANAQDWVAVRVIAERGWALSSAFHASNVAASAPLISEVKMVFPEISSQQQAGGRATVWDGGKRLSELEMERNELEVTVPASATIRIEMGDGRSVDVRPMVASGVRTMLGDLKPEAWLDWATYEEVRRRLRRMVLETHF